MTDQIIEQEIQTKGLTAPRVTPADIEANIAQEFYFTAAGGAESQGATEVWHGNEPDDTPLPESLHLLTFCVLVLRNGFTVTGESACASPENFDAEVGRKIARQNAVAKIWPLMGYELRTKLAAQEKEAAYIAAAVKVESRIARINQGDRSAAFTDDDLVYAAQSRCTCGAGLAYPKDSSPSGSWHCSDILTYRAATADRAEAKPHDRPFPFSVYSIKSENQPSAHGATTRPQPAS